MIERIDLKVGFRCNNLCQFCVQGDKREKIPTKPRAELEAMYQRFAPPKQLHWIESTDHFFAGGLEELEEAVKASAE